MSSYAVLAPSGSCTRLAKMQKQKIRGFQSSLKRCLRRSANLTYLQPALYCSTGYSMNLRTTIHRSCRRCRVMSSLIQLHTTQFRGHYFHGRDRGHRQWTRRLSPCCSIWLTCLRHCLSSKSLQTLEMLWEVDMRSVESDDLRVLATAMKESTHSQSEKQKSALDFLKVIQSRQGSTTQSIDFDAAQRYDQKGLGAPQKIRPPARRKYKHAENCKCYKTNMRKGHSWSIEGSSPSSLLRSCTCSQRQYSLSLWYAASIFSRNFAIAIDLTFKAGREYSITGHLRTISVVPRTSAGFLLLEDCSRGITMWPDAKRTISTWLTEGKISLWDTNPDGSGWLEV